VAVDRRDRGCDRLDALGRFATRLRSSGGTDTYAYLGAGETVAEISNAGSGTIRSMLDLDGSRLATQAGAAAATFTLFDHLPGRPNWRPPARWTFAPRSCHRCNEPCGA
jgi:hypothetical protein